MHIMTQFYNYSGRILGEYLPCIPELKLTEAKTYFGKITRVGGEYTCIRLSKFLLDAGNLNMWDEEDYEDLIDTICHEFAHMLVWEHNESHKKLTDNFKELVINKLKLIGVL